MCVLYVSFGSKVRPRTFGCVAMGSALLFIVRSRLLVYPAGSGVNRVQVVLSGISKRLFLFCPGKNFIYVWLYVFLGVLASTLCKYDLRKGDLFVLSWARVRRVRREVSLQSC